MNSTFIESPENTSIFVRALEERQEQILTAFTQTHHKPSLALLEELAELSIALEDVPEVNHVEYDPHQS